MGIMAISATEEHIYVRFSPGVGKYRGASLPRSHCTVSSSLWIALLRGEMGLTKPEVWGPGRTNGQVLLTVSLAILSVYLVVTLKWSRHIVFSHIWSQLAGVPSFKNLLLCVLPPAGVS